MLYPLREAKISRMRRLYREVPAIACKGLCHHSCGVITMTRLEHARIANSLGHNPEDDTKTLSCPLLKDGRCSQYSLRPLICRLFGVVEGMPCPHGCEAEKVLTDEEAFAIVKRSLAIGGEMRCTHTTELLKKLLHEATHADARGVQIEVPGPTSRDARGCVGGEEGTAVSPGVTHGSTHA